VVYQVHVLCLEKNERTRRVKESYEERHLTTDAASEKQMLGHAKDGCGSKYTSGLQNT